jgi:hypothetical protein
MREWMAKRREHGEKPPSADEVKDAVGPTPPDKEPGAPLPAPGRLATASVASSAPPRGGGVMDYLIGAGVVAAQAWLALKSLRKQRN